MAANNKCSDCGADREEKYKNDSCCKACRYKRNRAKRDADMLAKGKQPYGSGRSPNCSKCGKPKDKSFLSSGYCRACKLESIATKRATARIEKGQRPFGDGRSFNCYKCGKLKENLQHGYCNECHSANDRERRMLNKQAPEFLEMERRKHLDRSSTDPVYVYKRAVRGFTNKRIKTGVLLRKPCEICNAEKVDAHHDDYTKPLEVRWLCRKHHNEHHRNNGEGILPENLRG